MIKGPTSLCLFLLLILSCLSFFPFIYISFALSLFFHIYIYFICPVKFASACRSVCPSFTSHLFFISLYFYRPSYLSLCPLFFTNFLSLLYRVSFLPRVLSSLSYMSSLFCSYLWCCYLLLTSSLHFTRCCLSLLPFARDLPSRLTYVLFHYCIWFNLLRFASGLFFFFFSTAWKAHDFLSFLWSKILNHFAALLPE